MHIKSIFYAYKQTNECIQFSSRMQSLFSEFRGDTDNHSYNFPRKSVIGHQYRAITASEKELFLPIIIEK